MKSHKPKPDYLCPKSLGQHLLRRRKELKLRQKDVTKSWGISKETYANYEKDMTKPVIGHWTKIIAFLGYDPNPVPTSDGERLLSYRRAKGMSRKALAKELGVDEGTVWRWETGLRPANLKLLSGQRPLNLLSQK